MDPSVGDLPTTPITQLKTIDPTKLEIGQLYVLEKVSSFGSTYELLRVTKITKYGISYEQLYVKYGDSEPWRSSGSFGTTSISPTYKFYLFTTLGRTIEQKAKVQAMKGVLEERGIGDTLGSILEYAGIKKPPSQSGVGRRRTRKRGNKKRTLKSNRRRT